MTSKCHENKNLVSFICFSFLVIRFSKQLLTLFFLITENRRAEFGKHSLNYFTIVHT